MPWWASEPGGGFAWATPCRCRVSRVNRLERKIDFVLVAEGSRDEV